MGKRFKYISGFFLVFITSALFYAIYISSPSSVQQGSVFSMPNFATEDMFGNTINSINLKGKNVFIQFIDPASENQVNILKKMVNEYGNKEIVFLIFLNTSDELSFHNFMNELRFALGDAILIIDRYEEHKNIFGVPACCEKFFLYDNLGKLRISGLDWKLYKSETLEFFDMLDGTIQNSLSEFLSLGDFIGDKDWLAQHSSIVGKEREYEFYVFSMFNELCDSCYTDELINELKESFSRHNTNSFFTILLSDDFSDNDVINFRLARKIGFPVLKADSSLTKRWNQFMQDYGKVRMNNIVFLTNKGGEIISVMSSVGRDAFFSNLDRLNRHE